MLCSLNVQRHDTSTTFCKSPLSQLREDEYNRKQQEIVAYLSEPISYHATKPHSSYFAYLNHFLMNKHKCFKYYKILRFIIESVDQFRDTKDEWNSSLLREFHLQVNKYSTLSSYSTVLNFMS